VSNCVAARLISLDHVIDQRLRLAARALRSPYAVWIEAEHLDINHRASLTSVVGGSDSIVIDASAACGSRLKSAYFVLCTWALLP
jgi:hypothetical protein